MAHELVILVISYCSHLKLALTCLSIASYSSTQADCGGEASKSTTVYFDQESQKSSLSTTYAIIQLSVQNTIYV